MRNTGMWKKSIWKKMDVESTDRMRNADEEEWDRIAQEVFPMEYWPQGFSVQRFEEFPGLIVFELKSKKYRSICPCCGEKVEQRRGSQPREAQDLPYLGRRVQLLIQVYEYKCTNPACKMKSAVEEFPGFLERGERITERFRDLIALLTMRVSAEGASRILQEMFADISGDTVTRIQKEFHADRSKPEWILAKNLAAGRRVCRVPEDMAQIYAEAIAYEMDGSVLQDDRLKRIKSIHELLDRVFVENRRSPGPEICERPCIQW